MTTSTGGMVACSQRVASEVGATALRNGGTAADACIAMDAVLHVTEPASTGLGGDMFALFYEAASGKMFALNGSGRAPMNRALGDVARSDAGLIPPQHGDAVTVPGTCAGWFDLVARFGKLAVTDLLQDAIRIARAGFAVAPVSAALWERNREQLQSSELTIDGRAPRAGETFRNPGLASVLERIAHDGPDAFYRGEVAERIAAAARAAGGAMTAADLAAHTSTWAEPISAAYRGFRVWECPPNGQGLAALIALSILEGLTFPKFGSAERAHVQIEALRLAFADARWYVADPAFAPTPVSELLSPGYASLRRARIDANRAATDVAPGVPNGIPGTVYLCAVDRYGNACSYVSSHFAAFGTGIVPPGLGFPLQNRGCGFSLSSRHPNAFAPGKRPYHTIIPGMLTRANGELFGPFGVMGGAMQPQGHLQVVNALLDDGTSPQEALDRPRFFIEPVIEGGRINVERAMPAVVAEGLVARGHDVVFDPPTFGRSMFGRGQVILRRADGTLEGGSDPRADGCALAT
jgi:gamma-glutamyltranspeptidase/glutathione hydrolase